jgi:hypothetical protein
MPCASQWMRCSHSAAGKSFSNDADVNRQPFPAASIERDHYAIAGDQEPHRTDVEFAVRFT